MEYIKQNFENGQTLDAQNLNYIENGIVELAKESSKLSEDIADIKQNGTGTSVSSVEPSEDDIPKVFINGEIPTTKDNVLAEMDYISKSENFHAYLEIKCQGSSSMNYPKKNFTVKLYSDEERETKLKKDFKGWGEQTKFCLKANYIDHSHARNIVSARLWADIVKSRNDYAVLPEELRTSPNQGAIDGFPIKVYANGVYQGLYTWNIPKDGWMNNMDEDLDTHCMLCGESNSNLPCAFREVSVSGWTDELHDTMPSTIKTSWENAISFVVNSSDEEFVANLDNYIDVQSVIDFIICAQVFRMVDSLGKNQMFFTYDGIKWIESVYDLDSTWGSGAYGGIDTNATETEFQSGYINVSEGGRTNLLYERVENLFVERIKARYNELRQGALSISNIINRFERFTDIIGTELYSEDGDAFSGLGTTKGNIKQIRSFAVNRLKYVDEVIRTLGLTKYTVTNNLTLVATSNTTETAVENEIYTATLTPIADSEMESVVITMGGVDITSTVYSDGLINIPAVTGDIIITATAVTNISEDGLLYALPSRTTFDGTSAIDTGVALASEDIDWTIALELHQTVPNNEKAVFSNETSFRTTTGLLTCRGAALGNSDRAFIYAYTTTTVVYGQCGGGSDVSIKLVFTYNSVDKIMTCHSSKEGVIADTHSLAIKYYNLANNMAIGGCIGTDGTVTSGFVGTIDDFKIYNRILTNDEITTYLS